MKIRDFTAADRNEFLAMSQEFYHSPAVSHPISLEVMNDTFAATLSQSPLVRGLILEGENGMPVGYAILTFTFSAEVGGTVVMLDEICFKADARGKGYGTRFFDWMFAEYANARRFRLEVTDENPGAMALYKRLGFTMLTYNQMVLDK